MPGVGFVCVLFFSYEDINSYNEFGGFKMCQKRKCKVVACQSLVYNSSVDNF